MDVESDARGKNGSEIRKASAREGEHCGSRKAWTRSSRTGFKYCCLQAY